MSKNMRYVSSLQREGVVVREVTEDSSRGMLHIQDLEIKDDASHVKTGEVEVGLDSAVIVEAHSVNLPASETLAASVFFPGFSRVRNWEWRIDPNILRQMMEVNSREQKSVERFARLLGRGINAFVEEARRNSPAFHPVWGGVPVWLHAWIQVPRGGDSVEKDYDSRVTIYVTPTNPFGSDYIFRTRNAIVDPFPSLHPDYARELLKLSYLPSEWIRAERDRVLNSKAFEHWLEMVEREKLGLARILRTLYLGYPPFDAVTLVPRGEDSGLPKKYIQEPSEYNLTPWAAYFLTHFGTPLGGSAGAEDRASVLVWVGGGTLNPEYKIPRLRLRGYLNGDFKNRTVRQVRSHRTLRWREPDHALMFRIVANPVDVLGVEDKEIADKVAQVFWNEKLGKKEEE